MENYTCIFTCLISHRPGGKICYQQDTLPPVETRTNSFGASPWQRCDGAHRQQALAHLLQCDYRGGQHRGRAGHTVVRGGL